MSKNIIAITNQKGGVGKTSLALNLSHELVLLGKQVLVIDTDPQSSISKNLLGEDELSKYRGLEDLFLDESLKVKDFIAKTKINGLEILPCHNELASVTVKMLLDSGGFYVLKELVDRIEGYEYILLDSPPNLGFMTLNNFIASTGILIPISPALYSLLGANDLLLSIEKTKKKLKPDLNLLGVVITMQDRRAKLYCQIEKQIREFFKEKVFKTVISRSVKHEESIMESKGVSAVDKSSKLSQEYRELTAEIMTRLEA